MTTLNYEEFRKYLDDCMKEALYSDSEGREILVIRTIDAFSMVYEWGLRLSTANCAYPKEGGIPQAHQQLTEGNK